MTYAKPEILVLGDAVRVIEDPQSSKMVHSYPDGVQPLRQTAAYDLDE